MGKVLYMGDYIQRSEITFSIDAVLPQNDQPPIVEIGGIICYGNTAYNDFNQLSTITLEDE